MSRESGFRTVSSGRGTDLHKSATSGYQISATRGEKAEVSVPNGT